MTEEFPKISAIIATRQEKGYIESCVRSILDNDYPADKIEVVVVDGMSSDGTADIVRGLALQDSRVKLVENPRRITPVAFNLGIQQSTGDIVCLVAAHSRLDSQYLKLTVQTLREHPEVWCVGGAFRTVSESYVGQTIAASMAVPVGVGGARFRMGNYHGYVDTVIGSYWRWVFDKVGLFDEELVRNQDDEFNYRLKLAGGKIWLNSDIRFDYFARSSLGRLARQYYQYGYWTARTMQKHRRPARVRQVAPVAFVLLWLTLLAGSLLWWPVRYALAAYAAVYIAALVAGMWQVGRRHGWKFAPLSPVVFGILHFGYGLGTLRGFLDFYVLRRHLKGIKDQALSR